MIKKFLTSSIDFNESGCFPSNPMGGKCKTPNSRKQIKLLHCIIYVFILGSSNIYAQDSLRIIPVKAWQLSRLIQDATTLRTCDSLQSKLNNELHKQGLELLQSSKALKLSVNLSTTQGKEIAELREALTKIEERAKIDLKIEKKKGNKKGGIGIVIGFIIAMLL